MGKQRLYGPQFKEEACALVRGKGYSAGEAARQLGIPITTLLSWLKALKDKEHPPVPEDQEAAELRNKIRELEGKLAQSEMEKEILKKAAAYFAREQR